LIHSSIF
jgi:hypothetical protein